MDKRWLIIIITLFVGLCCLYVIVDNSTSVGKGIVSVDRVIMTLPPGFTNFQKHGDTVSVENKYGGEKLYFESIERGNHSLEAYHDKTNSLKELGTVEITKNVTLQFGDIKAHTIYYHNTERNNNSEYIASYFDKFNNTFGVTVWNFKDTEQGESFIKFVIETLYEDYKKPQE